MKNSKPPPKTGDKITVSQFKGHLRDTIEDMTDEEALNLWNNVIAKNAPTLALKVQTKLAKPKSDKPKEE